MRVCIGVCMDFGSNTRRLISSVRVDGFDTDTTQVPRPAATEAHPSPTGRRLEAHEFNRLAKLWSEWATVDPTLHPRALTDMFKDAKYLQVRLSQMSKDYNWKTELPKVQDINDPIAVAFQAKMLYELGCVIPDAINAQIGACATTAALDMTNIRSTLAISHPDNPDIVQIWMRTLPLMHRVFPRPFFPFS